MNQIENFIKIMKVKQELMAKESNKLNNDFNIMMLKIKLGINDNIKVVDGFENYAISDNGDVFNLKFGKKIKPYLTGKPDKQYYAVKLYNDGIVTQLKIHQLAALAFINNDDPEFKILVDHKNNNRLDNRVQNLRWSTHSQNSQNMSKHKNSSSEWKGIYYNNKAKKWHTQIRVDGKNVYLGLFQNEIEAARTYDFNAKIYFGEYAKCNFQ